MVKFGKRILYKDWIVNWLDEKRNYVKESTYANYSNIVYNHLIPQLGKYKLNSIDYKMLQQLIIDKYQIGRLDNTGDYQIKQ